MPTTTDGRMKTGLTEDELRQLQHNELELEKRTDRLSLAGGLTGVFSVLALVIGITALTIALIANGKSNDKGSASKPAAPATPAATKSPAAPVAVGALDVKLGEMFVRPNAKIVRAGKVTFTVTNQGTLVHEMIVERNPVSVEANGDANEDHALGEVPETKPGKTGTVSLQLKPGEYQLFCNVPGHYAAGQKTTITVKG